MRHEWVVQLSSIALRRGERSGGTPFCNRLRRLPAGRDASQGSESESALTYSLTVSEMTPRQQAPQNVSHLQTAPFLGVVLGGVPSSPFQPLKTHITGVKEKNVTYTP